MKTFLLSLITPAVAVVLLSIPASASALSVHVTTDADKPNTYTNPRGAAPFTITFTATPEGAVGNVTYEWDFDKQSVTEPFDVEAVGQSVSHTYSTAGTYGLDRAVRA